MIAKNRAEKKLQSLASQLFTEHYDECVAEVAPGMKILMKLIDFVTQRITARKRAAFEDWKSFHDECQQDKRREFEAEKKLADYLSAQEMLIKRQTFDKLQLSARLHRKWIEAVRSQLGQLKMINCMKSWKLFVYF